MQMKLELSPHGITLPHTGCHKIFLSREKLSPAKNCPTLKFLFLAAATTTGVPCASSPVNSFVPRARYTRWRQSRLLPKPATNPQRLTLLLIRSIFSPIRSPVLATNRQQLEFDSLSRSTSSPTRSTLWPVCTGLESTVSVTVDFVADLSPVSATVDFVASVYRA